MLSFEPLPQARLVREHGHRIAELPVPRPPRPPRGPLSDRTREVIAVLVGFSPLIAVVAMGIGLMYLATVAGGP